MIKSLKPAFASILIACNVAYADDTVQQSGTETVTIRMSMPIVELPFDERGSHPSNCNPFASSEVFDECITAELSEAFTAAKAKQLAAAAQNGFANDENLPAVLDCFTNKFLEATHNYITMDQRTRYPSHKTEAQRDRLVARYDWSFKRECVRDSGLNKDSIPTDVIVTTAKYHSFTIPNNRQP